MDVKTLEKLVTLGRQLAETRVLDPLREQAMDMALDLLGAEYGYLILVDDHDAVTFRVGRDRDGNDLEEPREQISHTILMRVVANGAALITKDAASSIQSKSALKLQLRSVMCVPLISRGKLLGAVYTENRSKKDHFTKDDLRLLEYFAPLAAVAIENAIANQQLEEEIAERKRAEEALRESEERHRSIFQNAVMGLYRTTPNGEILLANPALVEMLGYESLEDLVQHDLEAEGYEPGYPRAEFKARIERDGQVIGWESAWKRRDGSTLHVRENAKAVCDAAGNTLYYEGTVEDITERMRAEEDLRKHRDHLEELVRERTTELRKIVNLMAGREVRMAGLKDAIRKLRAQLEEAGLAPVADDPLLAGWKE